jgi:hypothetical protein
MDKLGWQARTPWSRRRIDRREAQSEDCRDAGGRRGRAGTRRESLAFRSRARNFSWQRINALTQSLT